MIQANPAIATHAVSAPRGQTIRRTASTHRHTTSFLQAGRPAGPALVLVHGWPEMAEAWHHQIVAFAALGFNVIAPDLRGCGESKSYETHAAYAQREIVRDMVEMLDDLGVERALWVGHDWGAIVVSNLARHHPERCIAVAGISQPFNSLERGTDALIPLLNRDIYPASAFPAGQFDYMEFYHESFATAQRAFEVDVGATFKAIMRRGDPGLANQPFQTAFVRQRGGWFGPDGRGAPDLPLDTAVLDEDDVSRFVAAYTRTGFFGVNALYMNDAANREYFDEAPRTLEMPVLFLSGASDFVCDTEHSDLARPMREACPNLSYVVVPTGHWMHHERPDAVNAAICRWIVSRVPEAWPQG